MEKKVLVIGGGVIGLELGQVYCRLGSEVSVIEYADRITPIMDSALSRELMKVMKKQGVKFFLSHAVNKVEQKKEMSLTLEESATLRKISGIDSVIQSINNVKVPNETFFPNKITFDWNEDVIKDTNFSPSRKTGEIGLIAQEVLAVCEQATAPAPFDIDEDGKSISGEDYLTVAYPKLKPLLIESIK